MHVFYLISDLELSQWTHWGWFCNSHFEIYKKKNDCSLTFQWTFLKIQDDLYGPNICCSKNLNLTVKNRSIPLFHYKCDVEQLMFSWRCVQLHCISISDAINELILVLGSDGIRTASSNCINNLWNVDLPRRGFQHA